MLISKYGNVDEKILNEFFDKREVVLPELYRKFLIKYNGGETPNTYFTNDIVNTDVRAFYGVKVNGEYDFYKSCKKSKWKKYLKDGMLQIAVNCFGDDILLCVMGKNQGKVYFKYHDEPKDYELMANSFIEFINNCESEQIGHIKTIEERKQMLIQSGMGSRINEFMIEGWKEEIDRFSAYHQEEVTI